MNVTYNLGIPATNNDPSVDQPNMLINTNAVNTLIGVDHYAFNNNAGGYHKVIHQLPLSTPNTIVGVGQLYTQNVTVGGVTATQLFARSGPTSGSGQISQLTGHSQTSNGYQWLGGVLFQWGFQSFATGQQSINGTVTFTAASPCIAFPNALLNVTTTPSVNLATPTNLGTTLCCVSVNRNTFSSTAFEWCMRLDNPNVNYSGFYWQAIGY